VQIDRVFSGVAVSRPQAVRRRIGVTHNLSGTLGDEIGKAPADDIEATQPHVIFARRLDSFQMAEVAVSRQMFAEILSLIARLRAPPASA
jgi:hypothetical protein